MRVKERGVYLHIQLNINIYSRRKEYFLYFEEVWKIKKILNKRKKRTYSGLRTPSGNCKTQRCRRIPKRKNIFFLATTQIFSFICHNYLPTTERQLFRIWRRRRNTEGAHCRASVKYRAITSLKFAYLLKSSIIIKLNEIL